MSEIDSGIEFRQSGNIVKIAGDDDPNLCDINAKIGGNIIGVKTVATDNRLASDARVRIGGDIKALKLLPTYIWAGRTNESKKMVAYSGLSEGIWDYVETAFNADPEGGWAASSYEYRLGFGNAFYYRAGSYHAIIEAHKAQITRDLSGYDPNDYISAHLVVKPTKPSYSIYAPERVYYCEHGWIEGEYNFLEDITGELGTDWTSVDVYGPPFTTSKPLLGTEKGWDAGGRRTYHYKFYIELIPSQSIMTNAYILSSNLRIAIKGLYFYDM